MVVIIIKIKECLIGIINYILHYFHSNEIFWVFSDEDSDVEISNELTGDKKKVLDFFETATVIELQLMATCSKKKAEAIIELRPYKGWIDLVCNLLYKIWVKRKKLYFF